MSIRIGYALPSLASAVLGISVFFLTAAFFGVLHLVDGSWKDWEPSTCLSNPRGCFCEAPRDGLLRQPANTYSNLGFTLVGIATLCEAIEQRLHVSRIRLTPEEQIGSTFASLFGLGNIILGFGSGWFHASLTYYGNWVDLAGMYFVITPPILFAIASIQLAKLEKPRPSDVQRVTRNFVVAYFVANAILAYLWFLIPGGGSYIFGGLIIVGLAIENLANSVCGEERKKKLESKWYFGSLVTFIVAYAIWLTDTFKYICNPHSLLQGHAAWHLLCAVASWLIFVYFHKLAFPHQKASTKLDLEESFCTVV